MKKVLTKRKIVRNNNYYEKIIDTKNVTKINWKKLFCEKIDMKKMFMKKYCDKKNVWEKCENNVKDEKCVLRNCDKKEIMWDKNVFVIKNVSKNCEVNKSHSLSRKRSLTQSVSPSVTWWFSEGAMALVGQSYRSGNHLEHIFLLEPILICK